MVGALIDRRVNGDSLRVDVDDDLSAPGDDEAAGVGDITENACFDVPLVGDGKESFEFVWSNDGHHSLLTLGHQNFFGGEGVIAQQHFVEHDVHTAATVGG